MANQEASSPSSEQKGQPDAQPPERYVVLRRSLLDADEAVEPAGGWGAGQARLWQVIASSAMERRRTSPRRWLSWGMVAAAAVVVFLLSLHVHTLTQQNQALRLAADRPASQGSNASVVGVLSTDEAIQLLHVFDEVRTFFDKAPAWLARTGGSVRMGLCQRAPGVVGARAVPVVVRVSLTSVDSDRRIVSDLALLTGHACVVRLTTTDAGALELKVANIRVNDHASLHVESIGYETIGATSRVTGRLAGNVRVRPAVPAVLGAVRLADGLYRVEVSALWSLYGDGPVHGVSS